MEIKFEREALYAEVWTTPLTKLGKKYGLSDNGIRKICKALEIPLPERGHWARIAAGHVIEARPLPPTSGITEFFSRSNPEGASSHLPISDHSLLKRLAEREEASISVAPVLCDPNRLVAQTAKAVEKYRSALEKSRQKKSERKKALHWEPDFSAFSRPRWGNYVKKGVMELEGDVLPLRVSLEAADRGLRIWDGLIKACIARGMKASVGGRRLRLEVGSERIDLRMSERIEKVVGSTAGMSSLDIAFNRHIRHVGTGELRIFIGSSDTKFADSHEKQIESQLPLIVQKICRELGAEEARAARMREQERQRLIDEEKRVIERAKRAELTRLREEEKRKEDLLTVEAGDWERAAMIRAYVAHVERVARAQAGGEALPTDLSSWLRWAVQVAEKIDPTCERLAATKSA